MNLSPIKILLICFILVNALAFIDCKNSTEPSDTNTTATIDLSETHQLIRGFGAANILSWRPDMTASDIDKAFGTGPGQIGFTILRLRIPTSDSEFASNITTAKEAYSRGVTIIASPWSPPASMKTNGSTIGGELKTDSYAAYAQHLKSFADYMANNGVPLYAVSLQNEPDISVTYESCDWNAAQMVKFVKNNASSIGKKIIAPESYNFNHTISDAILNDNSAAANLSIVGGHIYGGGLTSYPLAISKGKEVWMTEHLDTDTSWTHVFATGKEIHECMNADMSAYIWWYIVRFYGPILENGNVSKRGFIMSQFARFVRPGFFRVSATGNPQNNVYVTAYKDGNKVVIVAINYGKSSVSQTFNLKNGAVNEFTPYVTSDSLNCDKQETIVLTNNSFSVTLSAESVTTFVSD